MSGANVCNRASDRLSRSPRLPLAKAWTSSTMTRFSVANMCMLSSWLSSSDSDSGVVNKICGGLTRCRALRSDGVSPVRASTRIGKLISSMGINRLRRTSVANAFRGEIYSVCRPSVGLAIKSWRLGKNPASVLPAPVAATSRACRPSRAASSISN